MELLLPAWDMSVLGKPLSLLPQASQDTCAQSLLLRECPVLEVSPSVILLPLCQLLSGMLLSGMLLGMLPFPFQVTSTNINGY